MELRASSSRERREAAVAAVGVVGWGTDMAAAAAGGEAEV
jgi:hypothetical protein